jgi:RNA polymerase sigma factor (sigma-70 family)
MIRVPVDVDNINAGLMRPAAEAARPSAGGTPAAGAGWAAADDVALIHAFRAGDMAGFERVFRRHSHRLRLRDLIGRTMDSLPPRQHAAFVLHELRGLSCRHVAERLGLTEAAAETLLVRARRRFRREFRRLADPGA